MNNNGAWGDMFNAQKTMMDAWSKMMGINTGNEESSAFNPFQDFAKFNPFGDFSKMQEFYNMQRTMMEGYNDFYKNFFPKMEDGATNPFTAWQKAMENFNPLEASKLLSGTASEVYEKMVKSNSFYLGLYQVWDEVNKKVLGPQSEEYKAHLNEFLEKYDTVMLENFIPMLPEEMRNVVLNPYNYMKTLFEVYGKFAQPWADAMPELQDALAQTMLKDPTKASEYLKIWKKTYDKTVGTLLTSPVVGQSREVIEQNNRVVDSMIDMLVSVSEYMTSIVSVASENSKKAFEDYIEMLQKGEQPKTFNEFFKMWSEKVEQAIEKHFYTDEFSSLIAFTADSYMKFKIESDKAYEKFLADTPIVTKSEVDSLYKTVYDLKKEVRSLKKALEAKETKTTAKK
ncbi:MAG: poly(R)-hydroxyalkanoic acid synthase [Tissierellia bacterium]|nr:poly(R)-hydroxyalkanoic acid synthase [Tissierellia bacterium]